MASYRAGGRGSARESFDSAVERWHAEAGERKFFAAFYVHCSSHANTAVCIRCIALVHTVSTPLEEKGRRKNVYFGGEGGLMTTFWVGLKKPSPKRKARDWGFTFRTLQAEGARSKPIFFSEDETLPYMLVFHRCQIPEFVLYFSIQRLGYNPGGYRILFAPAELSKQRHKKNSEGFHHRDAPWVMEKRSGWGEQGEAQVENRQNILIIFISCIYTYYRGQRTCLRPFCGPFDH